MGDREPTRYDALAQQQERLVVTIVAGLALAAVFVSPIIWFEIDDHSDLRLWTLLTLAQGFVVIYLARHRLGFRATAQCVLCLLTTISGFTACLRGPTPATMALHSLALLLAALFFGSRGAWLVFSVCMT